MPAATKRSASREDKRSVSDRRTLSLDAGEHRLELDYSIDGAPCGKGVDPVFIDAEICLPR